MKAPMITITLESDSKGGLQVTGPMDNAVLFLGMLELAKQAFFDFRRSQATKGNSIVIPQIVPPKVQ